MAHTQLSREVIHRVISAGATQLGAHGFRRVQRTLRRDINDLSWIVSIQLSQWNTAHECSFTLNAGVVWEACLRQIRVTPLPKVLSAFDGFIYGQPPNPNNPSRWWNIQAGFSEAAWLAVEQSVLEYLEGSVLAFFAPFQSSEALYRILKASAERADHKWWYAFWSGQVGVWRDDWYRAIQGLDAKDAPVRWRLVQGCFESEGAQSGAG
jgi:hypothetical protein